MEGTDELDLRAQLKNRGRFREVARGHAAAAASHLATGVENDLLYCALDLRMALEALVYENAARFADELTSQELQLWQPPKLLDRLLEIDPLADLGIEMKVLDPRSGEWVSLGRENKIGLSLLKRHYHALGSHLHSPTLRQILNKREPTKQKLRTLCEECLADVRRSLESSLWGMDLRPLGTAVAECTGCGATLQRRLNALADGPQREKPRPAFITVECSSCPASFEVRLSGERETTWREQRWYGTCPFHECDGVHEMWTRQLSDGVSSTCPKCSRVSKLRAAYIFGPQLGSGELKEGGSI
jgi:hypothetical protein